MGCPILLGYMETALKVSEFWRDTSVTEEYAPPLTRQALEAPALFKEGLERRAKEALRIIVLELLKRALLRSQMRNDVAWLADVPADLDYGATQEVLQKIKDRVVAWNVSNAMLTEGKARTEGELELVFIERVWQIATIAGDLLHDMRQESYPTAGTSLARAMAVVVPDNNEWMKTFELLKEAE